MTGRVRVLDGPCAAITPDEGSQLQKYFVPRSERPSLIKDCADRFQAVTLVLQDALARSATHPPIFIHRLTVASDLLSGPATRNHSLSKVAPFGIKNARNILNHNDASTSQGPC